MKLLAEITEKGSDPDFVERLLDAVGRSGHDRILPDHLLSAWLTDEASLPSQNLIRQGWDPASLAGLIAHDQPCHQPAS